MKFQTLMIIKAVVCLTLGVPDTACTGIPLFFVRSLTDPRRHLRSQRIWRFLHRQLITHLVRQKGS